MHVNDIYVIDPKAYKGYQQNKRQQVKTLILTTTIKILLMILLVLVGYFAFKVLEKKGYFAQNIVSPVVSHSVSENIYVEVLAQRMDEEEAFISVSKVTEKPLAVPVKTPRQEVATLSSSYIEKMKQALNGGE